MLGNDLHALAAWFAHKTQGRATTLNAVEVACFQMQLSSLAVRVHALEHDGLAVPRDNVVPFAPQPPAA